MLLSDRHKFIFLHNPKCGGASVKEAMKDYCENYPFIPEGQTSQHYHHWPASQAKSYFKQIGMDWKWSTYFKFTFVRNPWDRMVSLWKFDKEKGLHSKNFEEWLLTSSARISAHSSYEKYYLEDSLSSKCINFIGRLEYIQRDVHYICEKLSLPAIEVQKINTTNRKHYSLYYTDSSIKFVEDLFKSDIKRFKYKFAND